MNDKTNEQLSKDIEQLEQKVKIAIQERNAWEANFCAEQKAHRETKHDRMKLCDRISELEMALRDAISTYGPKPEILVTEERIEAWKRALNA